MSAMWRDQSTDQVLTIPNSGDKVTSNRVSGRNFVLSGFIVPTGFEGTQLTFNVAIDDKSTSYPLYDDQGNQVILPVAAGRAYALPAALAPWPFWEGVSNVQVTADRAFPLVKKG